MRKTFEILSNSIIFAFIELQKNKLRTFLSLLGITFGIFCIISVMAVVKSLEGNIQKELQSFGSNTVFIDKWQWGGGSEYPWWKFVNRPTIRYGELDQIRKKLTLPSTSAFFYRNSATIENNDFAIANLRFYGVSDDINKILSLEINNGRYISTNEFANANSVVVVGFTVAEKMFIKPEYAVGKVIQINKRNLTVIGVIKKQGESMIGGWDFDNAVVIPYSYARNVISDLKSDCLILVKAPDKATFEDLKGELSGIMRGIRRLKPTEENNFSLNDINSGAQQVNAIFNGMTIGGIAITILSFIVGIFGVANIMFVTVRERTSIIGLKKAIGAKSRTILSEFLMESAFLCVLGGIIGLLMVFGLTFILTSVFKFQVFISLSLFLGAVMVCIVTGILAGIIPAFIAARMDPVVAIRSK